MVRNVFRSLTALAVLSLVGLAMPSSHGAAPRAPSLRPKVEVVFCLDTTGSMTGLIDGAKAKIWAICNQIAGGRPLPDLKVGLVAYRDKGDVYVTKVYDLTDDLDAVHANLKSFQADGGGDHPEHVNQALYDSVHKIGWSKDRRTLRIIFLVGDAPPHMDYPEDVKYPVTCKVACERGIIINTIQCGTCPDCKRHWQDICKKAEGSYVAIPADGGVRVVSTPFDKRLAELNGELARTTLVYGNGVEQKAAQSKADWAVALGAPAAAERVAFNAKNGQCAAFDLLDAINNKKVKLEALKKEELPPAMQKMTLVQQKDYLAKLGARRITLNCEVLDLDKKRNAWIAKEQAEDAKRGKTSFDREVLGVLQKQARRYHIAY
jgi:hypothetical protein